MEFQIIENRNQWNDFISHQDNSQFLQSFEWGEFQKALGRRVWRVGLFEKDAMVGAAQIIEHYLGLGMGYLYCPRGPVCKSQIPNPKSQINPNDQIPNLIVFLKKEIVNYGHIFFRVEPPADIQYPISPPERPASPGRAGNIQYLRIPSIQPSHVLLLDLSQSEETLLAAMHPKTRYNIRLAERKGLKFENVILSDAKQSEESISHFWSLLQETAKRDKIRLHPKKYYDLMNQILIKEYEYLKYSIFNIQYSNIFLASGVFIGFGDTFAYVHGASSRVHREMMAPYLLHWQAIKFAKSAGYRYYDFGGVNPENREDFDYRPSWEGITRFKKGFASVGRSGHIINYPGTFDIVLNKWGYRLYQSARRVNYLIRHPPL